MPGRAELRGEHRGEGAALRLADAGKEAPGQLAVQIQQPAGLFVDVQQKGAAVIIEREKDRPCARGLQKLQKRPAYGVERRVLEFGEADVDGLQIVHALVVVEAQQDGPLRAQLPLHRPDHMADGAAARDGPDAQKGIEARPADREGRMFPRLFLGPAIAPPGGQQGLLPLLPREDILRPALFFQRLHQHPDGQQFLPHVARARQLLAAFAQQPAACACRRFREMRPQPQAYPSQEAAWPLLQFAHDLPQAIAGNGRPVLFQTDQHLQHPRIRQRQRRPAPAVQRQDAPRLLSPPAQEVIHGQGPAADADHFLRAGVFGHGQDLIDMRYGLLVLAGPQEEKNVVHAPDERIAVLARQLGGIAMRGDDAVGDVIPLAVQAARADPEREQLVKNAHGRRRQRIGLVALQHLGELAAQKMQLPQQKVVQRDQGVLFVQDLRIARKQRIDVAGALRVGPLRGKQQRAQPAPLSHTSQEAAKPLHPPCQTIQALIPAKEQDAAAEAAVDERQQLIPFFRRQRERPLQQRDDAGMQLLLRPGVQSAAGLFHLQQTACALLARLTRRLPFL